jgi:hypothetical protein
MNTPRSLTTAVIFGNNIYVIGGNYDSAGERCIDTVEKATINGNGSLSHWEYMPSLIQCRYMFASVVIDRYIYAIGGKDANGNPRDTIERAKINLDGTLSDWEIILTMSTPRACHAAVANKINRHIYIIGGEGSCIGKSVEAIPVDAPLSYGLTINHGALFTNQISVILSIDAPYTTIQMQVSNDGGFAGASWEPYVDHKDWTITQYGSYVIPRVVYVRFKDINGNVSNTFQDDIILDVTAPTGSVEIVAGASQRVLQIVDGNNDVSINRQLRRQQLPTKAYIPFVLNGFICPQPKPANVTLHLSAKDDVSGVSDMMISNFSSFNCANWEPYTTIKAWYIPPGTSTVYVKFRDHAGNVSNIATDSITIR